MNQKEGWPTVFDSPYYDPASPDNVGDPWPFYELVYNHYHNRLGLETPNTWKILTEQYPGTMSSPCGPRNGSGRVGGALSPMQKTV